MLLIGCSSNDQPSQIRESGYVNVERGRLFYEKFGSGEPIIIIHGGPGLDHSYLLPQMLELAKDHELIFYDQRGSGKSFDAEISSAYNRLCQSNNARFHVVTWES
ncbi:MAG: alpha/beta hydrolase [Holosporaceae bacterium]|nr:alpha/beta hydrolase [Holosporaceae bacterium]